MSKWSTGKIIGTSIAALTIAGSAWGIFNLYQGYQQSKLQRTCESGKKKAKSSTKSSLVDSTTAKSNTSKDALPSNEELQGAILHVLQSMQRPMGGFEDKLYEQVLVWIDKINADNHSQFSEETIFLAAKLFQVDALSRPVDKSNIEVSIKERERKLEHAFQLLDNTKWPEQAAPDALQLMFEISNYQRKPIRLAKVYDRFVELFPKEAVAFFTSTPFFGRFSDFVKGIDEALPSIPPEHKKRMVIKARQEASAVEIFQLYDLIKKQNWQDVDPAKCVLDDYDVVAAQFNATSATGSEEALIAERKKLRENDGAYTNLVDNRLKLRSFGACVRLPSLTVKNGMSVLGRFDGETIVGEGDLVYQQDGSVYLVREQWNLKKAGEVKEAEAKAEEPKAEEPKAEEPKAEEPKAEEPKAEESKTEEPKTEEPKAEESGKKVEEAKAGKKADGASLAGDEWIGEYTEIRYTIPSGWTEDKGSEGLPEALRITYDCKLKVKKARFSNSKTKA